MGRPFILYVSGATFPREYTLEQPVTSIGRSADNAIVLEDEWVSRRHAEVELTGGIARITDLGSTNGTLINGVRIEPYIPHELKEGDTVSIGSSTLVVRLSPAGFAPPTPPPVDSMPPSDATASIAELERTKGKLPARSRVKLLALAGAVGVLAVIAILAVVLIPGRAKDKPEIQSQPGQYEVVMVRIPVDIEGSKDIGSLHFELVYDWSVLRAIEVEYGAAADDAILEYSTAVPGRLIVEVISSSGINGNGSLAIVVFAERKDSATAISLDVENVIAYTSTDFSAIEASSKPGSYVKDGGNQPATISFSGAAGQ